MQKEETQPSLTEEEIIKQMENQESVVLEEEETIQESDDEENIVPDVQNPETEIKPLDRKVINGILNKIEGVGLKFGPAYFRINYINKGQRRFSADLVNPVIKSDAKVIVPPKTNEKD